MYGVALPVADAAALAAALDRAQSACESLDEQDALRPLMLNVLRTVTERLQPTMDQWAYGVAPRNSRPGLPDRWKYLNKLGESSALRPPRAAAYEAMDALLDMVWPIAQATSTKRSHKARADEIYRSEEQARDTQAKHQKTIGRFDAARAPAPAAPPMVATAASSSSSSLAITLVPEKSAATLQFEAEVAERARAERDYVDKLLAGAQRPQITARNAHEWPPLYPLERHCEGDACKCKRYTQASNYGRKLGLFKTKDPFVCRGNRKLSYSAAACKDAFVCSSPCSGDYVHFFMSKPGEADTMGEPAYRRQLVSQSCELFLWYAQVMGKRWLHPGRGQEFWIGAYNMLPSCVDFDVEFEKAFSRWRRLMLRGKRARERKAQRKAERAAQRLQQSGQAVEREVDEDSVSDHASDISEEPEGAPYGIPDPADDDEGDPGFL